LSDLKIAHNLTDLDSSQFNDSFSKSMVKGAERLLSYSNIGKKTKLVMTFPLLKLLGNEIAMSSWLEDSKRTCWMAC
jgi:hypothetical protein